MITPHRQAASDAHSRSCAHTHSRSYTCSCMPTPSPVAWCAADDIHGHAGDKLHPCRTRSTERKSTKQAGAKQSCAYTSWANHKSSGNCLSELSSRDVAKLHSKADKAETSCTDPLAKKQAGASGERGEDGHSAATPTRTPTGGYPCSSRPLSMGRRRRSTERCTLFVTV